MQFAVMLLPLASGQLASRCCSAQLGNGLRLRGVTPSHGNRYVCGRPLVQSARHVASLFVGLYDFLLFLRFAQELYFCF